MSIYIGETAVSGGGTTPFKAAQAAGYTGTEEEFNQLLVSIPTSEKQQAWDAKADHAATLAGYGITDAYTKRQTLSANTAAMYVGAGVNVPDDALAYVGKFAQYWWRLQRGEAYSYYALDTGTYPHEGSSVYVFDRYSDTTIQYADSVSIDAETGAISLVDPTTLTVRSTSYTSVANGKEAILGKYVLGAADAPNQILYFPSDYTHLSFAGNSSADNIGLYVSSAYEIPMPTAKLITVPPDQPTYAQSSDRNAYPDSGTVDGVTYTYLGVPFDNFITPARIETGTCTGGAGSESPNIISTPSTPFAAKAIFIQSAKSEISGESLFATDAGTTGVFYGSLRMDGGGYSNATAYNAFAFSPDHVSWYLSSMIPSMSDFTAAAHASAQMNTSGTLYRYLIIG